MYSSCSISRWGLLPQLRNLFSSRLHIDIDYIMGSREAKSWNRPAKDLVFLCFFRDGGKQFFLIDSICQMFFLLLLRIMKSLIGLPEHRKLPLHCPGFGGAKKVQTQCTAFSFVGGTWVARIFVLCPFVEFFDLKYRSKKEADALSNVPAICAFFFCLPTL